jgi:hypothetical protein
MSDYFTEFRNKFDFFLMVVSIITSALYLVDFAILIPQTDVSGPVTMVRIARDALRILRVVFYLSHLYESFTRIRNIGLFDSEEDELIPFNPKGLKDFHSRTTSQLLLPGSVISGGSGNDSPTLSQTLSFTEHGSDSRTVSFQQLSHSSPSELLLRSNSQRQHHHHNLDYRTISTSFAFTQKSLSTFSDAFPTRLAAAAAERMQQQQQQMHQIGQQPKKRPLHLHRGIAAAGGGITAASLVSESSAVLPIPSPRTPVYIISEQVLPNLF